MLPCCTALAEGGPMFTYVARIIFEIRIVVLVLHLG